MKPVLFNLFGIKIHGYGTMIFFGIVAAILLLNKRIKNTKYDEDSIFDMTVIAIVSGIIGGKLLYIITDIKNILKDHSLLKDLGSGFVIYGGIIGGVLSVYLYCKYKKWDVLKVFDLIIPSLALAQGFGRIGCFLAGCCYGRSTNLPIGVCFNNSPFVPPHVFRHPTQIYSSIFDFLLAIFLLKYSKSNKDSGKTFGWYVVIYGIGRTLVEFLRDDPRGNVGILSTSQFISLFTVLFGIIILNKDRLIKIK